MSASTGSEPRDRGSIERRGNSLRVKVYAGKDPVTGKRVYLTESTTDEKEARRIRTRFLAQVDKQRNARTKAPLQVALDDQLRMLDLEPKSRHAYDGYIRNHVGPLLGHVPVADIDARVLEEFYAELRRCRKHCNGALEIDHRVDGPHECRTVRHRYPPGRRPAGGHKNHDCAKSKCVVQECQPHVCNPLSKSTVSKIHHLIKGALASAVRWDWIETNPADVARKPKQPAPEPHPPTAEQVADIVNAAWQQGEAWGMLVWLVMVTGLRRGELLRLRWNDVDLRAGKLTIRKTKTRRMRILAIDPATVDLLKEHHARYVDIVRKVGRKPSSEAFLFSYEVAHDRHYDPDAVTHRYAKMCASLGIDSHLHELRHYSATELLTAGVDLRTVAGRLGHGGGGATTLRVYAAWVDSADRKAADLLGGRMKRPPPKKADSSSG